MKENHFIKKTSFCLFAILIAITILLTSCKPIEEYTGEFDLEHLEEVNYPVMVENIDFEEAPTSVISLSPSFTQAITALGFENSLIGVSDYCVANEEILRYGSPINPNLNAIIEAKPQLLLTQNPLALTDRTAIEANGIKVISTTSPKSVYQYLDQYAMFSLLYNGNSYYLDKTNELLNNFDEAITNAQNKAFELSFIYIMSDEMFVATGDTLAGDLLATYGENVAQNHTNYFVPTEDYSLLQPEIVFLSQDVNIENLPEEFQNLSAIQNNNVIIIDNSYFEQPDLSLFELVNFVTAKLEQLSK